MDIQKLITNKLTTGLINRFDEIFIEALKLKGHCFESRIELEIFVKQNCTCIDDFIEEIKFYYVHGNPFLEHHYKQELFEINQLEGETKITASLGYYRYA